MLILLWRCCPTRAMASSFMRFLDHTQRRITVGRTPLDEWSARRRDLYLTTHNTHNRQTSMPPVGFEPTISASERPQTYALDRAAARTGYYYGRILYLFVSKRVCRYLSYLHCRPLKFVHCWHRLNLLVQANHSSRITCCMTLYIYQQFTNQGPEDDLIRLKYVALTKYTIFVFFFLIFWFITQAVDTKCTKISHKIVPATNFTV